MGGGDTVIKKIYSKRFHRMLAMGFEVLDEKYNNLPRVKEAAPFSLHIESCCRFLHLERLDGTTNICNDIATNTLTYISHAVEGLSTYNFEWHNIYLDDFAGKCNISLFRREPIYEFLGTHVILFNAGRLIGNIFISC